MTKPGGKIMYSIRNGLLWACALLFLSGTPAVQAEEAILQYFGTSWAEITERLPEVAEAGYTALWLPPPFKGGSGAFSVGYDPYDRFDLGTKDQMGSIPTRYGTEADLVHLVRMAHRFGLRVYFDNVMAHTGGPMVEGVPGTLHPNGFVPEDYHLIRNGTNQYQTAGGPDWNNEWEVLNRNPFGLDIAQEDPNTSFGYSENADFPKWNGIRHPDHPEYYPDTDLPLAFSGGGTNVIYSTYANKEPYQDIGYTNFVGTFIADAKANDRFDWEDVNTNGQHDVSEASEPFTDTGIDPSRTDHQNVTWGYGDGIYNMGNPSSEDVNDMLHRAIRWFVDRVKADGFRMDAVKHVPDYFFGKQAFPKDASDEGYCGQVQAQFNVTRGYSDWDNHRDTVFGNTDPRNDAMIYGEHLGAPPSDGGYIDAGMRIANDNFLNAISGNIGSSLAGMENPFYVISPAQSVHYILSHDNAFLSSNDREQAHAMMLAREGVQIVYTDGYNESGGQDPFPKVSEVPFLGQFDNDWLPNLLEINRHFGWGYQGYRWSSDNYSSFTRYDEDIGNNGSGVYMLFAMTKNYEPLSSFLNGSAFFPEGARLFNYSKYDYGNKVKVQGGNIRNMDGSQVIVPPNRYYAYSFRIPEMPDAWGNDVTNQVQPIMIYENGGPAGNLTVTRTDGVDGDPDFNPNNLPDSNPTDYAYDIEIPIVTNPTNITFVARSDGSADRIIMKLDGGIDLNSQMGFITQSYGTRDNPPDQAKDRFLGYEEMDFLQRGVEKFAAESTIRNIIGSPGAETYTCTIGSAGVATIAGSGANDLSDTADWVLHEPDETRQDGTTLQLSPAPEVASGQSISIAARLGYAGDVNRAAIYYTTDGSDPEGSLGNGKGTTQVVEMLFQASGSHDGTGIPEWWAGALPALTGSTELRYKVAVYHNNAASRFPSSDADLDIVPRVETQFEITGFNPSAVPHYPHNDWGEMAVGLEDGFHMLRTKALLGRTPGDTEIYRENTQTFYLDKETPNGRFLWPEADGVAIGAQDYAIVVLADMTVEEVWVKIDDDDSGNDFQNGNGSWALAQKAANTSSDGSGPSEQRWEFDYVDTPGFNGTADINVILRETTSSTNLSLSDAAGHFTTVTRSVVTDDSLPVGTLVISDPASDGATLGLNSDLTFRFSHWFEDGVSGTLELLSYFSLSIGGEAAQPRSFSINYWVTAEEHEITYRLPNFYLGDPAFLHTLAIDFNRSGYTSLQATRLAYAEINEDTNNDGIPDLWELKWGLERMDLSPFLDYDSEGINDYLEYIADTDPTDPNVYFVIDSSYVSTNGDFSLVYSASSNRDYYVWHTDSLTNLVWARYSEVPVPGTGQMEEFTFDVSGGTNGFYQLEVALPE
jgi:glycosidase